MIPRGCPAVSAGYREPGHGTGLARKLRSPPLPLPAFRCVRATSELIQRGRKLYRERADKEWPLATQRVADSFGEGQRTKCL